MMPLLKGYKTLSDSTKEPVSESQLWFIILWVNSMKKIDDIEIAKMMLDVRKRSILDIALNQVNLMISLPSKSLPSYLLIKPS